MIAKNGLHCILVNHVNAVNLVILADYSIPCLSNALKICFVANSQLGLQGLT